MGCDRGIVSDRKQIVPTVFLSRMMAIGSTPLRRQGRQMSPFITSCGSPDWRHPPPLMGR
jgi:hypothetical protein